MFEAILPKGAPFFELLLQQNQILCQVATILEEIFENFDCIGQKHKDISLLEAEADKIHLAITRHLSHTFITPIDREDILHINKRQEKTVDLLHNFASRLQVLNFERSSFPMLQIVRTLNKMIHLTGSMLAGLSHKKDSHNTSEFLALRDECEMLLSAGLGELYDLEESAAKSVIQIMKWGRVYNLMELAFNRVVDLAESIEEAVLKNV